MVQHYQSDEPRKKMYIVPIEIILVHGTKNFPINISLLVINLLRLPKFSPNKIVQMN
jgi:hypothetical protein